MGVSASHLSAARSDRPCPEEQAPAVPVFDAWHSCRPS
jgi:hypothetical protein